MIQTIRLEELLRDTPTPLSRHLVTRPTGRAVRGGIERTVAETGCAMAVLDFTEVGLLDMSCADEVVAKLLLRVADEEEHYVVLSGITDSHLDAIDHVLERHGLSVASMGTDASGARVLGVTTPDVQTAFQAIQRRS